MQLPDSIVITNSTFVLDGGTTTLIGVSEHGVEIRIQLMQRMFPSSVAGRLFVDGQIIEVRSVAERAILSLLTKASISPGDSDAPSTEKLSASKNRISFVDEIDELASNSPADNLRWQRDVIIAFIQSDEYLTVARDGVPEKETLTLPDDYSPSAYRAQLTIEHGSEPQGLIALVHTVLEEIGCKQIGTSATGDMRSRMYHKYPYVIVLMEIQQSNCVTLRLTYNRQVESEWTSWLSALATAASARGLIVPIYPNEHSNKTQGN